MRIERGDAATATISSLQEDGEHYGKAFKFTDGSSPSGDDDTIFVLMNDHAGNDVVVDVENNDTYLASEYSESAVRTVEVKLVVG